MMERPDADQIVKRKAELRKSLKAQADLLRHHPLTKDSIWKDRLINSLDTQSANPTGDTDE